MREFPHLKDSSFPNAGNINVYKYENEFDYAAFDNAQMRVTVCSVPWDMGQAHVGNQVISGIGNVVYFDSAEKRDEWFAKIPDNEKHVFETRYRRFHSQDEIKLPLPYNLASTYNYVCVEYHALPVEYGQLPAVQKWFYFIRAVEMDAPNTTVCEIALDAWQTFIYDVDIKGMMLERGHAPMAATDAEKYLGNPMENCGGLLADDYSAGALSRSASNSVVSFNSENVYACIASTSSAAFEWGSKAADNWHVPVAATYTHQGLPSVGVIAIPAEELNAFIADVKNDVPQFVQTIRAVFFASANLLTFSNELEFAGHTVYAVSTQRKTVDFVTLNKDAFDYPKQYADIAKLYTYPYAAIEITEDNGNSAIVKIEDTSGKLQLSYVLQTAWPFLGIDAHINGIGGSTRANVTFANVTERNFAFSGKWYEHLHRWNIPTFAIIQGNAATNDYATHYDRKQIATAAKNAYDNEIATATAAKNNANANAQTIRDNAAASVACNTANTATSNASNTQLSTNNVTKMRTDTAADNTFSSMARLAEDDAVAAAATVNATQAVASGVVGAVGAAATGNVAGAVGSIAGAAISGIAAEASAAVTITKTDAVAAAGMANAMDKYANAASLVTSNNAVANSAQSDITSHNNTCISTQAATNANTMDANATRTYNAATANAARTKNTADSSIANQIAGAALKPPNQFGEFNGGDTAGTRPLALFATIVTQNRDAIKRAGDVFLRYGYMCDEFIDFKTFNVMPKFSYWKCSDIWMIASDVPDKYVDMLRLFLLGGVTIWNAPENIGKTSIYENGA